VITHLRIDVIWWAIVMRMKRDSLNFELTLLIHQLKDNPNVDKPLSLPILIWHRSVTDFYQKGVRRVPF
jgi:hypothetical protein